MAGKKILIVEDEEDILELLTYSLNKEGYVAMGVTSGEEALREARGKLPDLITLDLMLPGMDGFEICKLLKHDPKTQHIPILMLTAKGEEADIVTGLELGADDYVTKPFSPKVLVARIRTILRRQKRTVEAGEETLAIQDIIIHPGRHEVLVSGAPVNLTSTEFKILHYLARRPGWVFTRDQIIDAIHGADYPVTDRSIDVQIMWLRKKLGEAGTCVETVRGVGYRFKEE